MGHRRAGQVSTLRSTPRKRLVGGISFRPGDAREKPSPQSNHAIPTSVVSQSGQGHSPRRRIDLFERKHVGHRRQRPKQQLSQSHFRGQLGMRGRVQGLRLSHVSPAARTGQMASTSALHPQACVARSLRCCEVAAEPLLLAFESFTQRMSSPVSQSERHTCRSNIAQVPCQRAQNKSNFWLIARLFSSIAQVPCRCWIPTPCGEQRSFAGVQHCSQHTQSSFGTCRTRSGR